MSNGRSEPSQLPSTRTREDPSRYCRGLQIIAALASLKVGLDRRAGSGPQAPLAH